MGAYDRMLGNALILDVVWIAQPGSGKVLSFGPDSVCVPNELRKSIIFSICLPTLDLLPSSFGHAVASEADLWFGYSNWHSENTTSHLNCWACRDSRRSYLAG